MPRGAWPSCAWRTGLSTRWRANWKLICQNYSECYHCPTVHPALNQLSPFQSFQTELTEGPFLGGPMRLTTPHGSMTLSGQRCAPPISGLAGGGLAGDGLQTVYYLSLFPSFFLSLHPDYVMVHRLEPQAPDRTRVICEWLFHPNALAQPNFAPDDAVDFWHMTNQQDWHVCELSQRGVSSRAYAPGPYANLENLLAAFDREYLRVMGEVVE